MAPFRSLRRRLSRLFGWGRNSFSAGEPLEALAEWLGTADGQRRTADAEAYVGALESRYGIRIPDDFRRYLLHVAPSAEATDEEVTAWWGLGRIRSVPEEYQHEISNSAIATEAGAYLIFADYLVWCWAWAVCCSEGPNRGRVALIGGDPDGFVADSFSEFVERYLRDPAGMANTMPARGEE
jgi:hypothetical protein